MIRLHVNRSDGYIKVVGQLNRPAEQQVFVDVVAPSAERAKAIYLASLVEVNAQDDPEGWAKMELAKRQVKRVEK